jgi:hypothetical protein
MKSTSKFIEGFVIVPPMSKITGFENSWMISHKSFDTTEVLAWRRHIGPGENYSRDFSTIVQRWHDMGYRVKKAKMEISI